MIQVHILDNGVKIKWMVMEFIYGKMEEDTKDNTKMTKSMALENTFGMMEEFFRDIGMKGKDMEKGG